MSEEDRRNSLRIDRINLVQVNRFDEEGFRADMATGRTINISTGGLRLELHHPLPLRSKVTLNVVLGDQIVDLSGTVVYLESLDDTRCCMGIRFDPVDPETEAACAFADDANVNETRSLRERLDADSKAAVERGVFGAPTLFVGDEMFWGNQDFSVKILT